MSRLALLVLVLALPAAGWAEGRAPTRRPLTARLRSIDPLLVKAARAMRGSYAPYSGVHVGCALTVGGAVKTGFNSESKGDLQLCAEQATMAGLPRGKAGRSPVRKIAVVSDSALPRPCGRCLQVLSEVGSPDTRIVACNLRGESAVHRLRELMPTDFAPAPASALEPYRSLIDRAAQAYRASRRSRVSRYRPPFGAAVQTDAGKVYTGMVVKDSSGTFTPATESPLTEVAEANALRRSRLETVETVVIVGRSLDGGRLPLPTGDERQHLVDVNPRAKVVLYDPVKRRGAVMRAADLLPFAYHR